MPGGGVVGSIALAVVVGAACGPFIDRLAMWSLTTGSATAVPDKSGRGRPDPTVSSTALSALACSGACAVAAAAVSAASAASSVAPLPAGLALAVLGVAVSRTDLARHRIPDVLVGLLFVAGGVGLFASAWLGAGMAAYGRAWAASGACLLAFLALALVSPSAIGMGDVKLLSALALYLGFVGWGALLLGVVLGMTLAGTLGWALVAARPSPIPAGGPARSATSRLRQPIPLAPFLVTGAIAALLVPAAI